MEGRGGSRRRPRGRPRSGHAKPDVVVIDVAMPLLNGIEATQQITRRVPATRVLILSMHSDEAYVTRALQAGRPATW